MHEAKEKYELTMTPETERVLERALEFYARALCGQMDYICQELIDSRIEGLPNTSVKEHESAFSDLMRHSVPAMERMLDAKQEIWPELARRGQHYGVGFSKESDTAYGVYEVLRYRRSWHEHPEGGFTVNFHQPMQWSGEPLPECKVEEEER